MVKYDVNYSSFNHRVYERGVQSYIGLGPAEP
jgi:hypothetical protein